MCLDSCNRILRLVLWDGLPATEYDKVSMRSFVPQPPPKSTEWYAALRTSNRPQMSSRTRMNIENKSKEPQAFVLIIFGAHAHSYRVDLERTTNPLK